MGIIGSFGDAAGNPVIERATCTVCGACATICPVEVLSRSDGEIRIDPSKGFGCIACGQCMMVCPSDSIAVTGRKLGPGDVIALPAPTLRATFDQGEVTGVAEDIDETGALLVRSGARLVRVVAGDVTAVRAR